MSVATPTVEPMFHINPWRRLRALSHINLLWHDGGPMGETDFEADTISLRRGMTWEERRCTVLHEILHVVRGPVPVGWAEAEELRVQKETARMMLPSVYDIGDAFAWSGGNHYEAAIELGVDVDVLQTRLKYAHPAERGYLRRRFADEEGR